MVTKLRARLSLGLQLQHELPEENTDLPTQILLQRHPEELGDDFRMSFRALSAAARADIGAGAPLLLLQQFVAETKQMLQNVVLDDHRALSSTLGIGQRFVYNVVRRRLELQRQLKDLAAQSRQRSRRAGVARPRKPRSNNGMRRLTTLETGRTPY